MMKSFKRISILLLAIGIALSTSCSKEKSFVFSAVLIKCSPTNATYYDGFESCKLYALEFDNGAEIFIPIGASYLPPATSVRYNVYQVMTDSGTVERFLLTVQPPAEVPK